MSQIKSKLSSSNINLDGIELMDLFQIAHYLRLTSIIKVISSENEVGYILFENGEITHCKIENKSLAEEAFQEILGWHSYSVRNFKYDNSSKMERNINLRFEIFLLDTIRKLDENIKNDTQAGNKGDKEFISLYEVEKINDFCNTQRNLIPDILAISVLDIKEKNIVGISYDNEDNKDLAYELTNNFFSIGMNKNINNIEKILSGKNDQEFLVEEYYILGEIFQVSKTISDKFVLNLIWHSGINRMFALNSVRNVLLELDKLL